MKNLMWRLLRKNISKTQMIGFAIANLIGLTIVIIAVQFYTDVQPVFSDDSGFINNDYLIISRKIEAFEPDSGFSKTEIKNLESQKWTRRIGQFSNSNYRVYASIGFSRGIDTYLFFESIPDDFIDITPEGWSFDPNKPEIPVIVSKDHLALYNFGFAATTGMAKISEDMISNIPMSFRLSGNGLSEDIPGRIVGFSNRLNTIVVPDSFMKWSNSRYAEKAPKNPSRLIVEVNSPGDPEIEKYMESHNYEIAGDKSNTNKASYFLNIIISIVIGIGILISALSFFVLLLSIHLLLQKNSQKLHNLIMIGYSPNEVSKPYIRMVMIINLIILIGSIILMTLVRIKYLPMLESLEVKPETILPAIITAVILIGAITAGNIMAIKKKVKSLWLAP